MAEKKSFGAGTNIPAPAGNGAHRAEVNPMSIDDAKFALGTLEERVTTFVREKPVLAMGIALLAGYLVARLVTRR